MKRVAITNRNIFKESFRTSSGTEAFLHHIQRILPGIDFLILREKDLGEEEYEELARKILPLCKKAGVSCAIHDHPEIARKLGGEYLHLPLLKLEEYVKNKKEDAKFKLGTSVHSVEEAIQAEKLGASYLLAGHVFETDCKKGLPPRGLSFLGEVCKAVSIPVYAIGGINDENEKLVQKVGAAGACRMSGYMKYRRAMIISGGEECQIPVPEEETYVIACDKGYHYAAKQGIVPDFVLGDFDSFPGGKEEVQRQLLKAGKKKKTSLETAPAEKDDTDTMLAARHVVSMGVDEVMITCCLGGRVDHLFANLSLAAFLASEGVRGKLQGRDCDIYCIKDGKISLNKQENRYLSVFSVGENARDVTIHGTKYRLEHGTLTNTFPIGISNEWAEEVAEISVGEGMLFVMCCGESGCV